MLLLSLNAVFAEDNNATGDVVSQSIELDNVSQCHELSNLQAVQHGDVLSAGGGVINVKVRDSYNQSNKSWVEEGIVLPGATVKIYDSSNSLISTLKTNSKGLASFKNLNSGFYTVEISYLTYNAHKETIKLTSGSTKTISHIFKPDILLLVDYSSHNEKVDLLMNMSRRVAYISTTNFDKRCEWLGDCANYIHIDMFSESAYSIFTSQYLKGFLASSPANANYKVAYTFGTYNTSLLSTIGLHIVGSNPFNNTFETIENTYIGSYFQADDIKESNVLFHNMKNYLAYVKFLIEPNLYPNPTLIDANAPLMMPECGIYHPKLGYYTILPNCSLINYWIQTNPGFSHSGDGSLNWMHDNYPVWLDEVLDPKELYRQFECDYISNFDVDKKFVAIVSYYGGGDVIDELINAYEARGRPAFNIFKYGTKPSASSILNKIVSASRIGISSITSLYSWSLNYVYGSAESDLSEIDLAVLKGVNQISQSGYYSDLGPQIEWTYAVTYPSFEGVFGPIILSYVDSNGQVHPIRAGIEKMAKLGSAWADLKDMDNADKKVAIVLYNYPPGKGEIGASYLDVFLSTRDLIIKLAQNGYDIGCNPEGLMSVQDLTTLIYSFGNKGRWAQGLINQYVENNWDYLYSHNQLISINQFNDLTDDFNSDLYKKMVDYWGAGLGENMIYVNKTTGEKYIVIPGVWFGNVFITFQPSRGWEDAKNYHDLTIPPHQQYVAFYQWIDKVAGINAIVNMGTHGTLEWLPGRNVGVSEGDWTFELNLIPTIYPYIVSNPGEAMVARDRIAALMITHMTPAMFSSSLYGNYSTLLDYINRYKEQLKLNVTSNVEMYQKKILNLAPILGFRKKLDNETFEIWIDGLHEYLDGMENDFNTYGLHSLGKILTGFELVEEVITISTSQTKIYDYILAKLYPKLAGKSFYDDIQGNLNYRDVAFNVKKFLNDYVWLLVNGTSIEDLNNRFNIEKNSALYNSTLYLGEIIVNIQNNNEWNAILIALSGRYLKAGLFADPSYGDSIPTGYDGFASDSTRMPSAAAYDSAVKIVDLLIANYYQKHGKWPELTSLILWGTEISRTEGIGVAEFMYFLGCKPVWSQNGKVIGVEMIPLENLTVKLHNGAVVNRPRIDVFASMVTSNKDWIRWMLTSVKLAKSANESAKDNYVIKHFAENPSLDKLFGLPGNVLEGTGMSTLIPNTAHWNISSVNGYAADIYLNRVSYSWTLDDNGNIVIKQERKNYEHLLKNVDLITQNFDSTWRLFDSDDYYDWFGGLYNAARVLKKGTGNVDPDTAFVDIRNKNNYISRTYQEEIDFEIRSMVLNPKYIQALVSSGAAGMNSYGSRYQNLYASIIMGGGKINTELADQMADSLHNIYINNKDPNSAAGIQSSMAWMIYMQNQGIWEISSKSPSYKKLQRLVDDYVDSVIQDGVACCHHTCKNLAFNAKIIQMSSLSASKKAKFAQILSQATLTDPLYKIEDEQTSDDKMWNGTSNSNSQDSNIKSNANQGANILNNATIEEEQVVAGHTAAGNKPGDSGTDKVSGEMKDSSSDASSNGESNIDSYEISKKSASKSASAGESSMSIFVIVAIIILIAIFLVGYVRNQKDDFDDY